MEDSVASAVPSGGKRDTSHLYQQDISKLDISKLTPLNIEVISRQATINIGTIGHVAHGKSTVVKALSGVQTVRFRNELERNITIKLGYANAKVYKCSNEACPRPACYKSYGSFKEDNPICERPGCTGKYQLQRHVSFVDCFGLSTKFLKSDGSSVVNRELNVGDELMGPDGTSHRVLRVVSGFKELYKISFVNTRVNGILEDSFVCTGGHLLCLRIDTPIDQPVHDSTNNKFFVRKITGNENGIHSTKFYFDTKNEADAYYSVANHHPIEFEITVEAYLHAPISVRSKSRLFRATEMNFNGSKINLSIGDASAQEVAWTIGLWLGTGFSDAIGPCFILHKKDDEEILRKLTIAATKMGLSCITNSQDKNKICVNLSTMSGSQNDNGFHLKLNELRIIDNKNVPNELRFQTVEIREALVAGLIDSDAIYNNGYFDLEQSEKVSKELLYGFLWVVRSLGYVAHISKEEGQYEKFRVRFNGEKSWKLPIARKDKRGSKLLRGWTNSQQFKIESIGIGEYRGFEVDGDGRILLNNFLVAHNCPGHDILMATMLNGAAVMDAALLLVAGNEACPQPQTSEHLAAVEIMKLKHIIILQNKIDLVKETQAFEQHKQITKFVKGTVAESSPVIPISAQLKYNIDVVCEYICTKIPVPVRDFLSTPRLIVIRSFDVNKPGTEVDDLKGGVAGGSIVRGVLKINDEIEVRPGIVSKDTEGNMKCTPIYSRIISLFAEENDLQYAIPGGLIGVGTKIDPTLCRADRLVGQVLGEVGKLPDIFTELEINFFLLRRLLGVKTEGEKQNKVQKLAKGEVLMVNIGSTSTGGRVFAVKNDLAKIVLLQPVCTTEGEKIALSRRVEKHWRLIGWGQIMRGSTLPVSK